MPDSALRSLHRTHLANPGDVDAEERWLRGRARAERWCAVPCKGCGGETVVYRDESPYGFSFVPCPDCSGTGHAPFRVGLELAAWAGNEAARKIVGPNRYYMRHTGWPKHSAWSTEPEFDKWLRHLSDWPTAPVRAALAAGRVVLEVWEEGRKAEQRRMCGEGSLKFRDQKQREWEAYTRPRLALDCCARWLEDPSEERLEAWQRACDDLPDDARPWSVFPAGETDLRVEGILSAARLLGPGGEARVREAICEALCSWALGGVG